MEVEYAKRGVANAGLATGIIGTSLGVLNGIGGLGGLFNGNRQATNDIATAALVSAMTNGNHNYGVGCGCSEDHVVNRYELGLQQEIAAKDAQIALRDANTYGDQKMLEMYKYIDGQLKDVRGELSRQAVHNQKTEDSFLLVRQDVAAVKSDLECQISRERDERCCGDNSIITYVNATFYPKMVADVTTGTTTTAQSLYNPLPRCGCGCGKG